MKVITLVITSRRVTVQSRPRCGDSLCGSAAFRAERLGLSESGFILRGCASDDARRHSLKINRGAGEAEPHRREGGKAAEPSLETSSECKSERDLEVLGDSRTQQICRETRRPRRDLQTEMESRMDADKRTVLTRENPRPESQHTSGRSEAEPR